MGWTGAGTGTGNETEVGTEVGTGAATGPGAGHETVAGDWDRLHACSLSFSLCVCGCVYIAPRCILPAF